MPKPVSLAPSPLALTAGRAQGTLTATLSPAPTAAGSLGVTSANPAIAVVPASVAFAAGQTSIALPVSGLASGSTTIRGLGQRRSGRRHGERQRPAGGVDHSTCQQRRVRGRGEHRAHATAADSDGTVAKVEFYDGATLIGRALAAPYGATLASAPAGSHTLTAVATDNWGEHDFCGGERHGRCPPAVSLSAPANNAVLRRPGSDHLERERDRCRGPHRQGRFLSRRERSSARRGASPYSFGWTNVAAGQYSLTAVAPTTPGRAPPRPRSPSPCAPQSRRSTISTSIISTLPDSSPIRIRRRSGDGISRSPSGSTWPDENPSGLGAFEFPMRFPGAVFRQGDQFSLQLRRDYDSAIGRFSESDPIGLASGLNTYAYALNDPLWRTDPRGLATIIVGPGGVPIPVPAAGPSTRPARFGAKG